jgi:hypothetical protein
LLPTKSIRIWRQGLAEVISKLIFSNPPPTKYFDIIINHLYSKQLLNLVLGKTVEVYKKNLWNRWSIRLYLRLCVGVLKSSLRYMCLFAHSGGQHILDNKSIKLSHKFFFPLRKCRNQNLFIKNSDRDESLIPYQHWAII